MKRRTFIGFGCALGLVKKVQPTTAIIDMQAQNELLTTQNTIGDLFNHPKLQAFADKLLPWDGVKYDLTLPISRIGTLMPYHNNFNTEDMLSPLNSITQSTETVFYDFYNGKKPYTGLFLLRGKPGMPTAVITAGGGFQYVGSLHEAFPLAQKISQYGYNAVVVKYRAGIGAQRATQDLAYAINYLFKNQESLKIDMYHYSLWGASASARMNAFIGAHGIQSFGVENTNVPPPQASIMLYTGYSEVTNDEPPTFVAVGENDVIASPRVMAYRIQQLQQQNVETEFHIYPGLGHGFALGTGTPAEGWLDQAMLFWQRVMKKC